MLKPFKLITANTMHEAISCAKVGCKIIVGGTDLLVLMHKGISYAAIVDISNLEELKHITYNDKDGLTIGAAVTHSELEQNKFVKEYYPALVDGCCKIGSKQVRNKGTLGGNICNASPAADTAGPLLLYDAVVHIEGPDGLRLVNIDDFFTGVKKTVLKEGEIVVSVRLPAQTDNTGSAYLKLMKRGALEIGIVSTGIKIVCDKAGKCVDARVSLSAVAPTPIRAVMAEEALIGGYITAETVLNAAELAYEAANPKTWRNSEKWSKDMVKVYIPQTVEIAMSRMKGER